MDWFREEIKKAYGGRAPRVLDPFAGGGEIPIVGSTGEFGSQGRLTTPIESHQEHRRADLHPGVNEDTRNAERHLTRSRQTETPCDTMTTMEPTTTESQTETSEATSSPPTACES